MPINAGEYDVVLLPSFVQVEDWRKRYGASQQRGLFAQTVTTFNAWIADLWELHGDGRPIADSLQRQTIMQAAFEQVSEERGAEAAGDGIGEAGAGERAADADGGRLTLSPGVVKLAGKLVRQAAGVPEFDWAVEDARSGRTVGALSKREMALLVGIARYYELLASADLVELGQALSYLVEARDLVFPHEAKVLVAHASPLDWRTGYFFDMCTRLHVDVSPAPGAAGVERVPTGVDLRFGFPSGRYAQPALVADLLRDALSSQPGQSSAPQGPRPLAVVACADPLALYKQLEQRFADMGVLGCVQAQVPFSSTDFGRRFLALSHVVQDEAWSKDELSDALRPPFSGFTTRGMLDIDRRLRQDRIAQRDDCLAWLRAQSDTFSQLEEMAGDPEADILLGVFEQIAFSSSGRSPAWRSEQLGAASALRACTSAARRVGASMASCARVLEDVVLSVSYAGDYAEAAGKPRVLVTTQVAAAQMGAGSCDLLVLCDLTSDDYPVADKDDAASTLLAKLGFAPYDSALAKSRRGFRALQMLPSKQIVCLRPLNDLEGAPTYPAAMLQELVDAYRPDARSDDDLDELFSLPESFLATMVQRGEELLFANASAANPHASQACETAVALAGMGAATPAQRSRVALGRPASGPAGSYGFSPSPSQVEVYLECPYKWFVQRRIGVEELDEGFGPLERGSFAHSVLQEFYSRFIAEGQAKVSPSNIEHARSLMRQVADELERLQASLGPGSGRYVAADQMERRELSACKEQLVSYLDFESELLPAFHPAYLEFDIPPEADARYAGHVFVGKVDRIDVDDAGNAVIIDYKGSLSAAHEIAGKGPLAPGKVQTRMYAQVVGRLLGLKVVGALYVSYGAKRACAGAYDARVLESAHLPNMRHEHCRCAIDGSAGLQLAAGDALDYSDLTFSDMLDSTELLVADAIERMERGEVDPAPAAPDVCEYCPVAHCPKRGA